MLGLPRLAMRVEGFAESANARLEIGDWRLEIGDWRLEIGDCPMPEMERD
jgi:hypothetical protein